MLLLINHQRLLIKPISQPEIELLIKGIKGIKGSEVRDEWTRATANYGSRSRKIQEVSLLSLAVSHMLSLPLSYHRYT